MRRRLFAFSAALAALTLATAGPALAEDNGAAGSLGLGQPVDTAVEVAAPVTVSGTGGNSAADTVAAVQAGGGITAGTTVGAVQSAPVAGAAAVTTPTAAASAAATTAEDGGNVV